MDARVAALQGGFEAIARDRMSGLPVCNPALRVECVGFQPWEGKIVGVLVTPWTINLVLLPDGDANWRELGLDQRQGWRFPCGEIEFQAGPATEAGPHQACSLFSPPEHFADQATAVAAAQAVLEELMQPEQVTMSRRGFLTGRRAA